MSDLSNSVVRHSILTGDPQVSEPNGRDHRALVAHVERFVGSVDTVLHEIVSEYIHLDVLHIKPSQDQPFHTFVTCGMSDRAMYPPADFAAYQLVELYICLPAQWPTEQEDLEEERNYWPIRLLKKLARLPHEFRSWLFLYHSIPNGDPPTPYAEGTNLCGAMLVPPIAIEEEFFELKSEKGSIYFLNVLPLYVDELAYKLKNGHESLLDLFDGANFNGIADPRRADVV